jgi:hypothetical protein
MPAVLTGGKAVDRPPSRLDTRPMDIITAPRHLTVDEI